MIISHLIHDTPSLKACASTCFAWYTVTAPHLHHTLSLRQWSSTTTRKDLNPLVALHGLGLLPLVRKVRFRPSCGEKTFCWLGPRIFKSGGFRYFSALANVQELVIEALDLSKISGMENYFGHFSPSLRSIALIYFWGSPRQLRNFLNLFPKLDDIKIAGYLSQGEGSDSPDAQLAPIKGSMRGKLILGEPIGHRTLEILPLFRGMRFVSIDLGKSQGGQLLLDACTETLQTLCFCLDNLFTLRKRFLQRCI